MRIWRTRAEPFSSGFTSKRVFAPVTAAKGIEGSSIGLRIPKLMRTERTCSGLALITVPSVSVSINGG